MANAQAFYLQDFFSIKSTKVFSYINARYGVQLPQQNMTG
jgi:hypothetical protein